MSLHTRYNAHNEKGVWQRVVWVAACFLLGIFSICGVAYARYFSDENGYLHANVAQWEMKVNGISLADTDAASKIEIRPIPESGGAAPDGKIMPGQSGYFEVEINPEGTEVSFSYAIEADVAIGNLPNGMSIDEYSVNGGARVPFVKGEDKVVKGTVFLPLAGIFTEDDKVTVRFFWKWANVDFDEFAEYDIAVTAAITQYCGEDVASAKGGQTL